MQPTWTDVQRDVWRDLVPDAPENPHGLDWMLSYIDDLPSAASTEMTQAVSGDEVLELRRRLRQGADAVWTSTKLRNLRWNLRQTVLDGAPEALLLADKAGAVFHGEPSIAAAVAALKFIRVIRSHMTIELHPEAGRVLPEIFRFAAEERVVNKDAFFEHMRSRMSAESLQGVLDQLETLGCISYSDDEIIVNEVIVME